ncbi:MAG TPA: Clp protease N-terminal domain-containing protein [Planctomycetota bacterium]|nr:Clp protease N-terminal domain-containing protein [Planctomycetota bacterium]
MFERCSDRLRHAFVNARQSAEHLLHHRISSEHLLLGLLEDEDNQACQTLEEHFKLEPSELKTRLTEVLVPGSELVVKELQFDAVASDALMRSAALAEDFGHSRIGTEHLLLALCEQNSSAGKILRTANVDPQALRNIVASLDVSDGVFRSTTEAALPFFRRANVYSLCAGSLLLGPAGALLSLKNEPVSAVVFFVLIAAIAVIQRTFDPSIRRGPFRPLPIWGYLVKLLAILHATAAILITITALNEPAAGFDLDSRLQQFLAIGWCWLAAGFGYMAGDAQVTLAREVAKA